MYKSETMNSKTVFKITTSKLGNSYTVNFESLDEIEQTRINYAELNEYFKSSTTNGDWNQHLLVSFKDCVKYHSLAALRYNNYISYLESNISQSIVLLFSLLGLVLYIAIGLILYLLLLCTSL